MATRKTKDAAPTPAPTALMRTGAPTRIEVYAYDPAQGDLSGTPIATVYADDATLIAAVRAAVGAYLAE